MPRPRRKREWTKTIRQLRVEKGRCAGCGDPKKKLVENKKQCLDCQITSIWKSNRSTSLHNNYAPFNLNEDDFVEWYKKKLKLTRGNCEWCKEPFGKCGPMADHDHVTGEPRALLCNACNTVEGYGLKRIEIVATAILRWNAGQRANLDAVSLGRDPKLPPRLAAIELSFDRWCKFIRIDSSRDQREKRIQKVIDEMRSRLPHDDVEPTFNKLLCMVETQDEEELDASRQDGIRIPSFVPCIKGDS